MSADHQADPSPRDSTFQAVEAEGVGESEYEDAATAMRAAIDKWALVDSSTHGPAGIARADANLAYAAAVWVPTLINQGSYERVELIEALAGVTVRLDEAEGLLRRWVRAVSDPGHPLRRETEAWL